MVTAICLFVIWLIIFLFLKIDGEELYSLYVLGGSVLALVLISFLDFKNIKNRNRYRRNH